MIRKIKFLNIDKVSQKTWKLIYIKLAEVPGIARGIIIKKLEEKISGFERKLNFWKIQILEFF